MSKLIALIDVDSLEGNLALRKLAAYHLSIGDQVELFTPIEHLTYRKPDTVYASKIFKFTPDSEYLPAQGEAGTFNIDGITYIKGGSGYDLQNKLPLEVEKIQPNYSLYPCEVRDKKGKFLGNYAPGFCSRGCVRSCQFCVVPEKEGKVHAVGDIYDFWRGQPYIQILDNNLTALDEHFKLICEQVTKEKIKVNFSQGLDARLIDADKARLLSKIKLWKQIHFAFDHVNHEAAVRRAIETLTTNGVKHYKLMFYVLIGFDSTPEEDLYRVELLRGLGVDPFVMPFNKADEYQRNFARWVNHKAVFKTVAWQDYKKGADNLGG